MEALRSLAKDRLQKPRDLAKHLVKKGKLSPFQAHKLLGGATLGLRLGDYLILTPIGKGGMGSVFLAIDRRTGLHLAIKALPPYKRAGRGNAIWPVSSAKWNSRKKSHIRISLRPTKRESARACISSPWSTFRAKAFTAW